MEWIDTLYMSSRMHSEGPVNPLYQFSRFKKSHVVDVNFEFTI